MFRADAPYNELPLLPPRHELETPAVLKKLVGARAAVAALAASTMPLPDPTVVVRSMVLQEAKLSSAIENIVTTNDELYRQIDQDDASQSPAVKEIRRYTHALWAGLEKLKKAKSIDIPIIIDIASQIMEKPTAIRDHARTRIGNRTTGKVIYTPPAGEDRIRNLLANLIEFVTSSDQVDPIIRIATAHYQFEAIHPFDDGNGRTGRILNNLLMVQMALLDSPILNLSREILQTRREYYSLLQDVTEKQNWEAWLLYFLDCVEITAIATRRQLGLILEAINRARTKAPKNTPPQVLDIVFRKPYTRIRDLVDAGIAKRQTAGNYLYRLEEAGLLESRKEWRDVIFINHHLLEILTLGNIDL